MHCLFLTKFLDECAKGWTCAKIHVDTDTGMCSTMSMINGTYRGIPLTEAIHEYVSDMNLNEPFSRHFPLGQNACSLNATMKFPNSYSQEVHPAGSLLHWKPWASLWCVGWSLRWTGGGDSNDRSASLVKTLWTSQRIGKPRNSKLPPKIKKKNSKLPEIPFQIPPQKLKKWEIRNFGVFSGIFRVFSISCCRGNSDVGFCIL